MSRKAIKVWVDPENDGTVYSEIELRWRAREDVSCEAHPEGLEVPWEKSYKFFEDWLNENYKPTDLWYKFTCGDPHAEKENIQIKFDDYCADILVELYKETFKKKDIIFDEDEIEDR